MSQDHYEEFALRLPCPYCGAHGWCVTKSGTKAQFLHAHRTDPFRLCYAAGFEAGSADERKWRAWRQREVSA